MKSLLYLLLAGIGLSVPLCAQNWQDIDERITRLENKVNNMIEDQKELTENINKIADRLGGQLKQLEQQGGEDDEQADTSDKNENY